MLIVSFTVECVLLIDEAIVWKLELILFIPVTFAALIEPKILPEYNTSTDENWYPIIVLNDEKSAVIVAFVWFKNVPFIVLYVKYCDEKAEYK